MPDLAQARQIMPKNSSFFIFGNLAENQIKRKGNEIRPPAKLSGEKPDLLHKET
jgi:hypothetical protein